MDMLDCGAASLAPLLPDVQDCRSDAPVTESVRCSGVSVSGARCTRTALLPVDRRAPSDAEFCFKHRRHRSWRHRLAVWRHGGCCGIEVPAKTRQLEGGAFALLALLSSALLTVGVGQRNVAMCAAGALGLALVALGMCVAMWELLWRTVPLELAAHIVVDALHERSKSVA